MKTLSKILIVVLAIGLLTACGKPKTKVVYKNPSPQSIINKIEGCERVDYDKKRDKYVCQPSVRSAMAPVYASTPVRAAALPEIDIDIHKPKKSKSYVKHGITTKKTIATPKPKLKTAPVKPKVETTKPKVNLTTPKPKTKVTTSTRTHKSSYSTGIRKSTTHSFSSHRRHH